MSKASSSESSINKISEEWFKPQIDRKVFKKLLERSDYEGWRYRYILIYFFL